VDFVTIQNRVLSDRFDESKRAAAKDWINYRYGRLWAAEDWTFKLQQTDLVAAYGSNNVSLGTIGDIVAISYAPYTSFTQLKAVRPEEFYPISSTTNGVPSAYSIIGDKIYFDTPQDVQRTFKVVSEKAFALLSADGDIPAFPSEWHYVLVHGAAAEGLVQENDPSGELFETKYKEGLDDMKAEFLSSGTFMGAYPSWPIP